MGAYFLCQNPQNAALYFGHFANKNPMKNTVKLAMEEDINSARGAIHAERGHMKKTVKTILKVFAVTIVVLIVIGMIFGGSGDKAETPAETAPQETEKPKETPTPTVEPTQEAETPATEETVNLEHGELVDLTDNRDSIGVVIVKAKITSSYSNDATVKQNYYNVEDLIKEQGFDDCEIQYWAVADMTSGEEAKVVSFTVPADVVKSIAAGQIVANELGDYVIDLYIHDSLK